jgi:polysaccharide biosynthesis/export protein
MNPSPERGSECASSGGPPGAMPCKNWEGWYMLYTTIAKFKKFLAFAFIAASACVGTALIASSGGATDATAPASDMRTYKFAPGDRITVTVFGQPDLSGDFLIDGAGNIQMPLIGAVAVGQITMDACQQRLAERLADGLLNNPRVSVRVSEFRPIHVLGDVRVPGSYPFRFGLSALGAIALAGGVGLSDVRQSVIMADLLAGEERVKVLNAMRLSLTVRLARMEAERLGKNTFEVREAGNEAWRRHLPGLQSIADGVGIDDIDAVMREEHDQLATDVNGHEQTIALLRRQKPKVQREIAAIKEQIASEMQQLQLSQARLREYSQLAKRGLTRAVTEIEAQRQVAQDEGKISRLKAELARLDMGLGDLDIRIQEAENGRRLRMANESRDARTRLREIEASLPPARELLELRRQQVGLVAATGPLGQSYRILLTRGQGGSPKVIDEGTPLEPGDILEVRRLRQHEGGSTTTATCGQGGGPSCAKGRAASASRLSD